MDSVDWDDFADLEENDASAEEVDEVLAALDALMERTKSNTIREILEEACCEIAGLVDAADDMDQAEAA